MIIIPTRKISVGVATRGCMAREARERRMGMMRVILSFRYPSVVKTIRTVNKITRLWGVVRLNERNGMKGMKRVSRIPIL